MRNMPFMSRPRFRRVWQACNSSLAKFNLSGRGQCRRGGRGPRWRHAGVAGSTGPLAVRGPIYLFGFAPRDRRPPGGSDPSCAPSTAPASVLVGLDCCASAVGQFVSGSPAPRPRRSVKAVRMRAPELAFALASRRARGRRMVAILTFAGWFRCRRQTSLARAAIAARNAWLAQSLEAGWAAVLKHIENQQCIFSPNFYLTPCSCLIHAVLSGPPFLPP